MRKNKARSGAAFLCVVVAAYAVAAGITTVLYSMDILVHRLESCILFFILFAVIAAFTIVIKISSDARRRLENEMRTRAIAEEQYRIAAMQSGKEVVRYSITQDVIYRDEEDEGFFSFPPIIDDASAVISADKRVSSDSMPELTAFFESIKNGVSPASACVYVDMDGEQRWFMADSTTIFDGSTPLWAVISLYDVTERREMELAYEKWRQTLGNLSREGMALHEHNLTRDFHERAEGNIEGFDEIRKQKSFNARAALIADTLVHPDDAARFRETVELKKLLSMYYQGVTEKSIDFRFLSGDDYIWMRLDIQLVQYPATGEIKAYLVYFDINREKCDELLLIARSEEDPLTKLYNRAAFVERVSKLFENSDRSCCHALMMIDLDGFKAVNDALGHDKGDSVLIESANNLRSVLRQGDLVGRVGGDEFMVCLRDVKYDSVIDRRARLITELLHREFTSEISTGASLGISVYPRDGVTFDELYVKSDRALYKARNKNSGSYAFYKQGDDENGDADSDSQKTASSAGLASKLLSITADGALMQTHQSVFNSEYVVLHAADFDGALALMREHASTLFAVFIDLSLPDRSAFEIMKFSHRECRLSGVPFIAVTDDENGFGASEALGLGAADCVLRDSSPSLLRARVRNVVAQNENTRLRVQNSYLLLRREEETRFRAVLKGGGLMVIEHDCVNGLYTYDRLIPTILSGNYDGRGLFDIFSADGVATEQDVKRMQQTVSLVASDGKHESRNIAVKLKTKGGEFRFFKMGVAMIDYKQGISEQLAITFEDVHEDVVMTEYMRSLAELDSLTGLYNRSAFIQLARAKISAAPANTYILAQFDIDNFRAINELFGHAEGDRLLRAAADGLREAMGEEGLCCRISADEFAALYPADAEFRKRLDGIRASGQNSYDLPFDITITTGRCLVDDPAVSVDTLLDHAALAIHTVKDGIGGKIGEYTDELRRAMLDEQEIIGMMHTAIEQRQFVVHLQPQIDMTDGTVVGAEALVRWDHPDKGLIPPARFLSVFEKNGFVSTLDRHVWETVCVTLRRWIDSGAVPVPISVNASRMDLYNPKLSSEIVALIGKYRLDPSLFRFEITEDSYLDNPVQMKKVLNRLRDSGFAVKMDNFGSGYSSINTLKDMPADILKLDMHHLAADCDGETLRGILEYVIGVGRRLGLQVVAESVSEKSEVDMLLAGGCSVMQGFYCAPPMDISEFERQYLK